MSSILTNEAVIRVQKALNEFNENIKIIILESIARTAKDAANALNCEIGAIVKSLLLKADDGFILCLIPGDKKCSLNKLKKLFQKKMFAWLTRIKSKKTQVLVSEVFHQ